jgi:hypothetical protein
VDVGVVPFPAALCSWQHPGFAEFLSLIVVVGLFRDFFAEIPYRVVCCYLNLRETHFS